MVPPATPAANDSFYCSICLKNYKNQASFRSHLKSTKHLFNSKSKHSIYQDENDNEPAKTIARISPDSQTEQIYCRPCKLSVSYRNIGRHLTSSFHSYNQQFHSKIANQMALKFIREIVQWSPFQCAACKLFFNHERHFRAHWLSQPARHRELDRDPDRFWLCHNNYCTFYCRTADRMQKHFDSELHRNFVNAVSGRVPLIVQNFKAFRCRVCRQQFRLAKSLQEHEKSTNHNKNALNYNNQLKSTLPQQCDICNQKFDSIENFEAHKSLDECTGYELLNGRVLVELQCEICKQLILRKSSVIRSHFSGHLALLKCTVCLQLLQNDKDPKLFLIHLRNNHVTQTTFKCTICLSSFDKMNHYFNHCKLNTKCDVPMNDYDTGKKPVHESKQQKIDTDSNNNNSTDRKPDAAKLYQCSQCDFVAHWKSSLKRHTLSHTKYQCRLCKTGLAKLDNLLEHYIETHMLDDKLFKCPLCKKRYSRIKNLRQHFFNGSCAKRHQTSFLYECKKCRSFGTNCTRQFSKHLTAKHSQCFHDSDAIQCFVKTFFIDVSR